MNLIAIVDQNWGIARNGEKIITIPGDLEHFKRLTMGGTVIMGRKTYEVIGHALQGRRNIVLSKDSTFFPPDAEVYGSIDYMMDVLEQTAYDTEWFVIGGESIYRQLIPYCDRAYITFVFSDFAAGQFIPNFENYPDWECVDVCGCNFHNGNIYVLREYRRVQNGLQRAHRKNRRCVETI